MAYAAVFAGIGLALLVGVGHFGLSPMALPFAGGFMLVGPALLGGFFELVRVSHRGGTPGFGDALRGFVRAPAGIWAVAIICAFLFLIWITDAAVLYSFMVGGDHLPYEVPWLLKWERHVVAFELWSALMGSVLAFVIFAVSAFSVPLLFEERASLVQAIHASVRAVFRNFLPCLTWGLLITGATVLSILLLPVFVVVLPVLAFASFALYRKVFPEPQAG